MPLIDGYFRLLRRETGHFDLLFMQDGAPAHRNQATIEELQSRGIYPIEWPPYSPDLNPIKQLWDWIKDWIGTKYLRLHDKKLSYDLLRRAVQAAWDAIPSDFLDRQIDLMQKRCEAVIAANGMHTPY